MLILAIGFYLGLAVKAPKNYNWKELSIDHNGKGYGFTSDALFNSDIPLPEIKKLSGKSKFIKATDASANELTFGYIISVDIDKLNLQKLPEKYKVEQKEQYKAGEFTIPPIKEAVFEIYFEFIFKDKDGFEILKLNSPHHNLFTGKINSFQDTAKQTISSTIADRVAEIAMNMTIEKCVTCK